MSSGYMRRAWQCSRPVSMFFRQVHKKENDKVVWAGGGIVCQCVCTGRLGEKTVGRPNTGNV